MAVRKITTTEPVVETLRSLVTPRRAERIERVIEARLKGITVLLEGIYDHGNVTAVMRSCDALGVHNLHLVDLPHVFKPAKRVAQGAQKWLDVRIHDTIDNAAGFLSGQGYRLIATDLDATQTLDEIDVSSPVALVFGNEREGVSPALKSRCDQTFVIPMLGYVQSLNISCAAAISLHNTTRRYRNLLGRLGDLDEAGRAELREWFYRRTVKRSEILAP